jgi:hypothetical protein
MKHLSIKYTEQKIFSVNLSIKYTKYKQTMKREKYLTYDTLSNDEMREK